MGAFSFAAVNLTEMFGTGIGLFVAALLFAFAVIYALSPILILLSLGRLEKMAQKAVTEASLRGAEQEQLANAQTKQAAEAAQLLTGCNETMALVAERLAYTNTLLKWQCDTQEAKASADAAT